ncbi:hypothetical protein ABH935_009770 [Catenulispora sp. GAS73]|uniref:hypothetical protein n=1 Tax=Catenulispora sp. GAS73 TaxID=3156269 RepID=UPI0035178562
MLGTLHNRDYRLILTGQLLSSIGTWLLLVAAPFFVLRLTGSTMATGLSMAAETVPAVLLGPVAGALFQFGCFGVLWGSVALPLSAAPWHLSTSQIGLFGVVGAAGTLSANGAGRLADRGRASTVTTVMLVLLVLSWAAIRAAPFSLVLLTVGIVVLDFAGQALQ